MPEYIERKTIVQWLKEAGNFLKIEEDHKRVCHVIGKIIDHIEAMPTADVAEVVRCRDCKFYNKKTGFCLNHSYFKDSDGMSCSPADSPDFTFFNEDDFCSRGKRKESDTE